MLEHLALPWLLGIFAVAAAAVWIAGVKLCDSADVLSERFGWGEALGGMILLAIATNLPEIAIVVSAAWRGQMGVAIGNILGGIAIQTTVLAVLDLFGLGRTAPLTLRAEGPALHLEAALVIAVLALTILGHLMPESLILARVTPAGALIVLTWIVGLYLIGAMRKGTAKASAGKGESRPVAAAKKATAVKKTSTKKNAKDKSADSTGRNLLIFGIGSLVTLIAGVALEVSGESIAKGIGMQGALFGATILAAATALPEVSTGLAAMRLRDYGMAFSDIFGGNAFLPVLFLLATLISGKAVLPDAKPADIYLTALGMLLTAIYMAGLVMRSNRQVLRMGVDSFVVVLVYALGIVGLFFVAG